MPTCTLNDDFKLLLLGEGVTNLTDRTIPMKHGTGNKQLTFAFTLFSNARFGQRTQKDNNRLLHDLVTQTWSFYVW